MRRYRCIRYSRIDLAVQCSTGVSTASYCICSTAWSAEGEFWVSGKLAVTCSKSMQYCILQNTAICSDFQYAVRPCTANSEYWGPTRMEFQDGTPSRGVTARAALDVCSARAAGGKGRHDEGRMWPVASANLASLVPGSIRQLSVLIESACPLGSPASLSTPPDASHWTLANCQGQIAVGNRQGQAPRSFIGDPTLRPSTRGRHARRASLCIQVGSPKLTRDPSAGPAFAIGQCPM